MEEQIVEQQQPVESEEIVIGIPKNAALIKITVLCMMPDGNLGEVSGKIDVEQIGIARARFLQITGEADEKNEEREESGEASSVQGREDTEILAEESREEAEAEGEAG